jgi:leucine dehydrogenase
MVELSELQGSKIASPFAEMMKLGHEQVVYCYDEPTGLKALIGIHNTVLGPALGGTRLWHYEKEEDALVDVLRLSRGMTFKAAISGLNLGGGKAVIIGRPEQKTEAFLRRFGRFVESLGGRYITAEDVNMNTRDMEYIGMETNSVTGLPEVMGGGGDPSPVTAYGTYLGMKAAAKKVYGNDSLTGKTIAVQGVGQVGKYLVELLVKENAKVYVSDISEQRLNYVSKEFGAIVLAQDEIFDVPMDIFAPCALGAILNDATIDRLKCQIVAGAANNQLADEDKHGPALVNKGIVYCPDFLINAGGLINVYNEYLGNYNRDRAYSTAEKIYDTCAAILNKAEAEGTHPQQAAMEMAINRINQMGKVKLAF